MNIQKRMTVYAHDVVRITGTSRRSAFRLMNKIRKRYGKDREAFVTLDEFCAYTGLPKEEVAGFLT